MRRAATLGLATGEAMVLAALLGASPLVAVYGVVLLLLATLAFFSTRSHDGRERWFERAPRALAAGLLALLAVGVAVAAVRDGGALGLLQISFASGVLLLASGLLAWSLPAR